ncbi:hypothetical protein [Qiania dongpingensis]|uniref:Uncharacterized protein n=1 Tax=Qiania dongpingensis TaxID=2763669 RepID=A0A7G9G5Q1_9FIRM|nr:hypothetical protein [Qiania dongpingensis]QNM06133.1 hypothetical protein H9Q78_02960 [Qiania dongpingensis]
MSDDYNALSYRHKFRVAFRTALILLAVVLVAVLPSVWCWEQSVLKRQTLREAKNVLENMELLSLEYYGFGEPIADFGRTSGLSEQAEEEIRRFAGVEGEIHLTAWNQKEGAVTAMTYQKGKYLVWFRREKAGENGTWEVYRSLHQYGKQS